MVPVLRFQVSVFLLRSDCVSAIAAISYPASTKVSIDLMPDWSRTLIMQTLAKFLVNTQINEINKIYTHKGTHDG